LIDLQATETGQPLVLLAEDNEANIMTISSYLKAQNYQILSAQNGREAIEMVRSHQPALVLMDIQMPEMDGLTAIAQIRQDPDFQSLPIIALTALAMAGDQERCLQAGATAYLNKPVKLKQLANMIQELLKQ
jgi:CheY-like chemotaxis protein